jgi:hypothetical protein
MFESIRYEIVGLQVINHVIKMIISDFLRIKRVIFGHIRHTLIKFSESSQDASAIDLQLLTFSAQAELNCEPIQGRQFLEV